ncbi:MAG: hypothetical protein MZU97_20160 [Bacillus subtilis]|nr:hypothetical protein [Bacillus subtilis]
MKRFLSFLVAAIAVLLVGCDFLSTIIALKDFSGEYNRYNAIYQTAEQTTVDTTTSITVTETNIENFDTVSSHVYAMFDKTNGLTYIDQTLDSVQQISVLKNEGDLLVEYVILANNLVLPTIPEGNATPTDNAFNMEEQFSFQDLDNEHKIGEHAYAFNLPIDNLINLDVLLELAGELAVFDSELAVLNNAIASVEVAFEEVESVIDVHAILADYRMEFADGVYAIVTIVNHTIVKIPADFAIVDVFADPYVMLAVDDIRLATKVYLPDAPIAIPLVANQNGWVKLQFAAGTYTLESAVFGVISQSYLTLPDLTVIPYNAVGSIQVTIATEGVYYFYLIPTTDVLLLDLVFVTVLPIAE